jgi:mono/diheme cytochrome c family protein/glucose/arabinose dehydrogenase
MAKENQNRNRRMTKQLRHFCLLGAGLLGLLGCAVKSGSGNKPDEGPSPTKTPTEALAAFQLEPGLKIQLVAAEPLVQDPVVITFDADGRLWVVEMRGFMPNIDGEGERAPVGRVSVLEDTDGDGQMDISTVYLDSLILPRAIALVPGGALIAEKEALWLTQDLDGDLKADTKVLIDPDYAGSTMPEHAGNGLWRGMDNWYYNAKSRLRYRLMDGEWQRDSTEFRGQWGVSHDDKGRLYYNYNWSQLHADLVPPNYLSRNKNHSPTTGIDHGLTVDRRIYPIRPNPAVNRGYIPGTLDEKGRLLEFTAACSPFFYRGTALPKEYYANAFVCEPAGNLIKRNVVQEEGLLLTAYDPTPGREFLASTDERFRPVHLATGPDGALYVADMYRGLIEHGPYITPYLREQTLVRKLDQPTNYGRIWRIVPEKWEASKPKKLSAATSEELVRTLSHPNGWHRDMAQRLLVERQDRGVEQALAQLATTGENQLGRFHALWTLEGLKLNNPDLLFGLLLDQSPLIRATAVRLLEPLAKADKQVRARLGRELLQEWEKAPLEQVLQMTLTAQVLDPQEAHPLLAGIVERYGTFPLIRDAAMSGLGDQEFALLQQLWNSPQWKQPEPSKEIFQEMLATALMRKGSPTELAVLLEMLDREKDAFGPQARAVLNGLTMGGANRKSQPVSLASAPALFTHPGGKADQHRLADLAALFAWPGHSGSTAISSQKSALGEADQKLFALGRQHYLSTCAGCHGTDGAGLNRFAPPLVDSEWVLGDEKRLALIILHGMEGPVEVAGKMYDAPEILPVMPAHSTLDDAAISAIMTYIRNEWGNNAGPISRRLVGTTRNTSQGRVMPWKVAELEKYLLETKAPAGQ